jgi:3'(2'), 5'-bisphosphate nucleotidase
MNSLLQQLLRIAEEASELIMAVYREPFEVAFKKGPHDPVTQADQRANDLICERLEKLAPGIPVVAEESPEALWRDFRDSAQVFFVDPLDGTREFVKKSGQFVVMIGLLDGARPSHGLMFSPVTKTAWLGMANGSSVEISANGRETHLQLDPAVRTDQFRAVVSRGRPGSLIERSLEVTAPTGILPVHSAGLKAAALARGDADVYLAPESAGCRWDSCAPEAIIRGAGGIYTDATGQPLDYRAARLENAAGIIAAAPELHGALIEKLRPLLAGQQQ